MVMFEVEAVREDGAFHKGVFNGNMFYLPRIGEEIEFSYRIYKVKRVIYDFAYEGKGPNKVKLILE